MKRPQGEELGVLHVDLVFLAKVLQWHPVYDDFSIQPYAYTRMVGFMEVDQACKVVQQLDAVIAVLDPLYGSNGAVGLELVSIPMIV